MSIHTTNNATLRSLRHLVTRVSERVPHEDALLLQCLLYGHELTELTGEIAELFRVGDIAREPADVTQPPSLFPDLLDSTAATAAVRERHARSVRVGNRVDAPGTTAARVYLVEFADATPERELLDAGARITGSVGALEIRDCAVEVHLTSERLSRYQSRIRERGDVLWSR